MPRKAFSLISLICEQKLQKTCVFEKKAVYLQPELNMNR